MRFRAAAAHLASGLSSDLAMDPHQDVDGPKGSEPVPAAPPEADGADPATPGGAAPYNGAEPFSAPVADDPEWHDPREETEAGAPVPHIDGPGENVVTLRNARRQSYEDKAERYRARS